MQLLRSFAGPLLSRVSYLGAILTVAILAGCVSYLRPEGPWSQPPVLEHSYQSLAGWRVKVVCGAAEDSLTSLSIDRRPYCLNVAKLIRSLGAHVVNIERDASDDESPEKADPGEAVPKMSPDFTVAYIAEDAETDVDWYWTSAALLTGTLVPAAATTETRARLRFYDHLGRLLEDRPLYMGVRSLYGIGALVAWLGGMQNQDANRRILRERLATYIQNATYTFAVRMEAHRPMAAREPLR